MVDRENIKKILTKAESLKSGGEVGMAKELLSIEEKIDTIGDTVDKVKEYVETGLDNITENLKKKLDEELSYEIDKESIRGEKGDNGKDGSNGKDGRDGKDGISIKGDKGEDGKDGTNGKDGKDGSPDTPEDIVNKIESLEGDFRLKASAIQGLEIYKKGSDNKDGLGGSIARNFYQLFDVPQSYTGQSGKALTVKSDASGLEFTTIEPSPWVAATGGINYAGGNVGINNATPSEKLSILGAINLSTTTGAMYDNSSFNFEVAVDANNAGVSALYIYPKDSATHRVFFGTPSRHVFAVNFANVDALENVPVFSTPEFMQFGILSTAAFNIGRYNNDMYLTAGGPAIGATPGGNIRFWTTDTGFYGFGNGAVERMVIEGTGRVGINRTATGSGHLEIGCDQGYVAFAPDSSTGQSYLTDWQGAGGVGRVAAILPNGSFVINPYTGAQLLVVPYGSFSTAAAQIQPFDEAKSGLIIRAAGSSQTADLQQWQTSTGTVLNVVGPTGNVGIGTSSPGTKLEIATGAVQGGINVFGSNIPQIQVGVDSSNALQFYWYSGAGYFGTLYNTADMYFAGKDVYFAPSSTQSMVIKGVTGNVGIGTASPNANAILDLTSTTKAFMPPRATTVQIAAVASPTEGMVMFDTTLHKLSYYNGTVWTVV